MLMFQLLTNPVGIKLFSYVNTFFCSNKFAQMSATWVKTLYNIYLEGEDFNSSVCKESHVW